MIRELSVLPTQEQMASGLIHKRREIASHIESLQRQLKDAVETLDSVEATIRLFVPSIDLLPFGERPVPPPHAAFKGEISRILLSAFRHTTEPLSTRELTEAVMQQRGLPIDDLGLRRTMQQRVGACLNQWKRVKGVVRSSPGERGELRWELIKPIAQSDSEIAH